jgi:hypothetical protein
MNPGNAEESLSSGFDYIAESGIGNNISKIADRQIQE